MTEPDQAPLILCSASAFIGYSLPAVMRLARDGGADGIELVLSPRTAGLDPGQLRRYEEDTEFPIRSVHAVLRLRRAAPETLADDIKQSAAVAAQLRRCTTLVVHPPDAAALHDRAVQTWIQAVLAAQERGERCGFKVAVENMGQMTPRATPGFFDHPDRLRWLAQEWDLALTFDTAHAASRGWDLLATAASFGPRLANLHLSDSGGRTHRSMLGNALLRDHRFPGEGDLPLQAVLEQLRRAGNSSRLITLEMSPLAVRAWWPPRVRTRLRQAIDLCRLRPQPSQPQPSEQSA